MSEVVKEGSITFSYGIYKHDDGRYDWAIVETGEESDYLFDSAEEAEANLRGKW